MARIPAPGLRSAPVSQLKEVASMVAMFWTWIAIIAAGLAAAIGIAAAGR